ncbi:hypothetical protein F3Y22_tig00111582pilonHSYRG01383 [Hibiscus syriacus]|uniref:Malic enzyme N-terminal domain-containing protein n=1 Tax=Hibiscus syriacus TaxID=106335 RepID=A0A6A2XKN5_HIBSY|nr:hypothetical protein F3Y22_tig00111582pilonHSYRG01383 [Hibiscus syriacus]
MFYLLSSLSTSPPLNSNFLFHHHYTSLSALPPVPLLWVAPNTFRPKVKRDISPEGTVEYVKKGVPFILKAGKALNSRKAEIHIQFKEVLGDIFQCQKQGRNEFIIRLQPYEAMYMKLTVKQPGLEFSTVQSELDFSYRQHYQGVTISEAYERLILDTIRGDQQHFVRRDELKIHPVMLDVGTNNLKLIDNPLYLGLRQPRLEGEKYLSIIDEFIEAVLTRWPKAIIQWRWVKEAEKLGTSLSSSSWANSTTTTDHAYSIAQYDPPFHLFSRLNEAVSVNSNNSGGNTSSAAAISADTQSALRHNPGISLDWDPEEQTMLEDLLVKFASDSTIVRYAKIAKQLKDKTVREVALLCRWMSWVVVGATAGGGTMVGGEEEHGRLLKFLKPQVYKEIVSQEKGTDSSAKATPHLTARPNGPAYAVPMIPMENDDGIPYEAIGGVTGELFEQNAQMFNQISSNFAAFQMKPIVHDNINLLCKARDNILTIMNDRMGYSGWVRFDPYGLSLNDLPEVMKQMPPLPVKVNEELANIILRHSSHQMKS